MPEMPKTMALLLFRNGDRLHEGATFFVKRWPPPNMTDFLAAAGKACKPIIGPVMALLTMDMRYVRSLDEFRNGGVYLLKGRESLDPPPLFFNHPDARAESRLLPGSRSAPSLRSLHVARETVAADQIDRLRHAGPESQLLSPWASQASTQSIPVSGSPPYTSVEGLPSPFYSSKWEVE